MTNQEVVMYDSPEAATRVSVKYGAAVEMLPRRAS